MLGLTKPAAEKQNQAATTEQRSERRAVAPRVDIRETDAAVILTADMPGVAADGVEVRLHGDVLTLAGRSAVAEPERFSALWREYAARDYERAFRLGQVVDPEGITAAVKDGVLRVELRKRAAATPRKIAVTAG